MTKSSRYFLVGSGVVLLTGICGGLVAYLALHRTAPIPAGLPAELRYVPVDAQMVAYADVQAVMGLEMRRELERLATGRRGQQQLHQFAGIDLEKDVNHVVAYMQRQDENQTVDQGPPRIMLLAQGKFDQPQVEQFLKEHGATAEDYHGRQVLTRGSQPRPNIPSPPDVPTPDGSRRGGNPWRGGGGRRGGGNAEPDIQQRDRQGPARGPQDMSMAFLQPDVMAMGPIDLIHKALDASATSTNVTANADLMTLIREDASSNAWVVGRFEAVSRRLGLPPIVTKNVPPLRLVSASAHVDGGVKATIKALAVDTAGADQLRDVVRSALSFVRLQAGDKPEVQEALKTIELGGTGTSIQLSFMMTPAMIQAIMPHPPAPPQPPVAPQPPQPNQ